ncbi:MAG: type I-U CRISPR-associated protein Cas5/Cas6 [Planctomycetes bacterium]|nr:type I-U CRISPR-associated protein Cas5/Cas6 [Planctomycetota bacterium]
MSYFCLSVTFLDGTYHGRGDDGVAEWPPSPLRLFQSLVATAAARLRTPLPADVTAALNWLAQQSPPALIASRHHEGVPYKTAVPNNAMDIVAKAWSRGNESSKDAQVATHKTMKTFRSLHLDCPHAAACVWRINDDLTSDVRGHIERLQFLASQIVAVGWGIDLVAGHAAILSPSDIDQLPGERWEPGSKASNGLRIPNAKTVRAVMNRHQKFLRRLFGGQLSPVPALSTAAYSELVYRRAWDPAAPRIAAFEFLRLDTSGWRSFDTLKTCHVAGMLRHAAAEAAEQTGWDKRRINSFVLGHGEKTRQETHQPVGPERFAYIPLPSLEPRRKNSPANHVGAIRRALLFVPASGHQSEINWGRRALSGCELTDEQSHSAQAIISLIRDSDKMVTRYTKPSAVWATVTPVILPGYDDPRHLRRRLKKGVSADEQKRLLQKLSDRTDSLIRKAITQAGFSDTLAMHAEIEWRKVGYWPGADHVDRYFVPKKLQQFSRYHVRVTWRDPDGNEVAIPGPIVIGGGRYRGLGAFAAVE